MKKIMTITMFIFVFNTIVFGTTETPQYPNAIMWEPFYWQYNGSAGDILISALDYENAERTAYRYQDTVENDNSVGDFTKYWADRMGWESGVTYILTHRFDGDYLVLTAVTDPNVAVAWADDDEYLHPATAPYTYYSAPLYEVFADMNYCSETHKGHNWKAEHDQNKSIVWLGCCNGFENFSSVVGGKTVFSYFGSNYCYDSSNINRLFNYMNGCFKEGCRKASDAYASALADLVLSDNLRIDGGASTFAPTPSNHYPIWSTSGGSGGTGYIVFDTKMNTSIDPANALKWTCTQGIAIVSNIHWEGDQMIKFSYCGFFGYRLQMTADAGYCLASIIYGSWYHALNGDGTAGNTDDFMWSFSY